MTEISPTEQTNAELNKDRFARDINEIQVDLENRFRTHLSLGDPTAALEARLFARLIELREFDQAMKWASEYQGSLDRISENDT